MDDGAIIDLLDERWRTIPQIRSKVSGISGHALTRALHRLADAGRVEKSARPTQAIRRRRDRKGALIEIEMFRLKLGESRP